MQSAIFEWAANNKAFNNVPKKIPGILLSKLKLPLVHRVLYSPRNEFENEWNSMVRIFNRGRISDSSEDAFGLTELMIGRDVDYLKNGRPDRELKTDKVIADSSNDSYSSFIWKHAVLLEPTGSQIFDKLFLEVKHILLSNDPDIEAPFLELKRLWEERHPGQEFYPILDQA